MESGIVKSVERSNSQPGDLTLELPDVRAGEAFLEGSTAREFWREAQAESCGLSVDEFAVLLTAVGDRLHYGLTPGTHATTNQRTAFLRGLRLPELALAQACARGHEVAWQRFLAQYRAPVLQAAIAISGSATVGHDMADQLYGELFGLKEQSGQRRSPLASYSGRGSLMGWLRTTLAQRHVDHHRRTYRETALDDLSAQDAPAQVEANTPGEHELTLLGAMLEKTLRSLTAEDRYLLAAYFLDRQTLQALANVLRVHEATVSRRLKRLTEELRKRLLAHLQGPPGSLSRRAAEEALGTDPRDLEINLRVILQSSQVAPFLTVGEVAEGKGRG